MTTSEVNTAPVPAPMTNRSVGAVARASGGERVFAACVAVLALGVLVTACWLTPSGQGFGTHRQLGLAPCGWAVTFGKPCLTCGMTTSFTLMAHGRVWDSILAQPMGAVLSVLTAASFWPAAHQAVFGSLALQRCGGFFTGRMLWVAGVCLALAWGYKMATWPT